jgi:hypothetical protein
MQFTHGFLFHNMMQATLVKEQITGKLWELAFNFDEIRSVHWEVHPPTMNPAPWTISMETGVIRFDADSAGRHSLLMSLTQRIQKPQWS